MLRDVVVNAWREVARAEREAFGFVVDRIANSHDEHRWEPSGELKSPEGVHGSPECQVGVGEEENDRWYAFLHPRLADQYFELRADRVGIKEVNLSVQKWRIDRRSHHRRLWAFKPSVKRSDLTRGLQTRPSQGGAHLATPLAVNPGSVGSWGSRVTRERPADKRHMFFEIALGDDLPPFGDRSDVFLLDGREVRRRSLFRPRCTLISHEKSLLDLRRHSLWS